jgi:hypothetical protein
MKNVSDCAHTRGTGKLALWTLAWLLSMALATFGPQFLWDETWITGLAIGINLLIGLGVIVANRHHLQQLDEMQRKIQLEAMGIALGLAVVAGLSYSLLDITNLVAFDAEISHLVILIGLTYMAATIIGTLRYR